MKKQLILALLFFSMAAGSRVLAQKHYVVEIDRLSDKMTYKLMEFQKGKPIEKVIPKPSVKLEDIVTVRMINFNELIYGLEDGVKEDQKLGRKETSIVSQIVEQANILPLEGLSPSLDILNRLLQNPPTTNRGGADDKYSLYSVHTRTTNYLKKVADLKTELELIYTDEGCTLQELKTKFNKACGEYPAEALKKEYKEIKSDLEIGKDSSDAAWTMVDQALESENEEQIDNLDEMIKNYRESIRMVDFLSEYSFRVGEGAQYEDYEKYKIIANVYKRAAPVKEGVGTAKETKRKYEHSDHDGDQLYQSYNLDLFVKNKYKPTLGIAVSQIFIPRDRFDYEITGGDVYDDSLMFQSISIGGSKTAVGLNLGFNIPINSPTFTLGGCLGYSMAFWKGGRTGEESKNRGFVTTGFTLGLRKFNHISLSAGSAWSEFEELTPAYRPDKNYPNDLSSSERTRAIRKKIRPAFYAGLSFNL